jgi:2',3'-cyclic-nucleotide 2'-phosphodiesterase/3'-nucleotidase
VKPGQPFIVVTNNYRASGGGGFPGMDDANIVLSAPDGNREVVIHWVEAKKTLTRKDVDKRSWTFAPLKTKGAVTFTSASGKEDVAKSLGLPIRQLRDNGDGTAVYSIDLSKR